MNGQQCLPTENIVRAIRSSDWDEGKARWSSDLFRGPDTSVSRLAILPLPEIFRIFFADLHHPPLHRVLKVGEINIGNLQQIGQAHVKNRPISITVVADPVHGDKRYTDNPAHALVKQKLPRLLALAIITKCSLHDAPTLLQRLWWVVRRPLMKF